MECPDENLLLAFGTSRCSEEERRAVGAHLDGCEPCVRLLAVCLMTDSAGAAGGVDPLAVTEQGFGGPPGVPLPAPTRRSPGEHFGRFVLLEKVGGGSMGEVWSAYDPQLDRRVALKLLVNRHRTGQERENAKARLLREAQALARLAHPNVVSVHDHGEWDGQAYVQMEYVVGTTLSEWLSAKPRSHAQVLEVFRQAGEGLAAAHRAGLVHRDFKPDNVLVGSDDRVRVTDFGLVRWGQQLTHFPMGLVAPLTPAGALIGTPAYMAPEQFVGQPVDASGDQYSFCVSLYEALYGRRPFSGKSVLELFEEIRKSEVPETPPIPDVPTRLHRALRRGLSRSARARFPSMDELLAALTPPRGLRRWLPPLERWSRQARWVAGVSTALTGGVLMGSLLLELPRRPVPLEAPVETAHGLVERIQRERQNPRSNDPQYQALLDVAESKARQGDPDAQRYFRELTAKFEP